ncbi:MAG: FAD-binding oxidoreductase [Blastocatellia bacterium]
MSITETVKSPDHIYQLCVRSFGADRARLVTGDAFRIADEKQRVILSPRNLGELSEMLMFASREKLIVIPAGAGTWLEMGNPPVRAHVVISTAQMNRVLEYEPADLTASVEAGCTLAEFNAMARRHRQCIPLDPFGAPESTLGAIVATASAGPLRCAYGTPRDQVIGMRVVHANGSMTKAGGKVVKNVAGYDLCKLYTGSYGTLGIIGEINFKLRSLAEHERTMHFFSQDASVLCDLALQIMDSDAQPAAMELFCLRFDRLKIDYGEGRFTLALRFINPPEMVQAQMAEAIRLGAGCRHTFLSESDATTFWHDYDEEETAADQEIILRISALPSDTAAMLGEIGATIPQAAFRVHAANGVIRIHGKADTLADFKRRQRPLRLAEMRQFVQSRGGQMTILRLPPELKNALDAWGHPGPTGALMLALKQKFDPGSLLNPGRFVNGI